MPECCGSLALQRALEEEAVSGEGPCLLTLKLPSKVEIGEGGEGEAGSGKGAAL